MAALAVEDLSSAYLWRMSQTRVRRRRLRLCRSGAAPRLGLPGPDVSGRMVSSHGSTWPSRTGVWPTGLVRRCSPAEIHQLVATVRPTYASDAVPRSWVCRPLVAFLSNILHIPSELTRHWENTLFYSQVSNKKFIYRLQYKSFERERCRTFPCASSAWLQQRSPSTLTPLCVSVFQNSA
jgi:hypothetical protein